jgi:hypothetical protein
MVSDASCLSSAGHCYISNTFFFLTCLTGNGIQDADEPGMPLVTAILVDGSGNELDRTVTDADGLYLFENLVPGTYAVMFEIPDEYLFTPPAKTKTPITNPVDGSLSYEDVTSDVNVETGVTDAVFLSSGKNLLPSYFTVAALYANIYLHSNFRRGKPLI